ncbi:peptide-methionine (S)-S-oxide reductase [Emticicia sp. TH156]|nr:peptide-methionine (S)-S-oxide reductase [Emticicia sp. TH156]
MRILSIAMLGVIIGVMALSGYKINKKEKKMNEEVVLDKAVATFGAGCFWCVEAVFQRLEGVIKVESGYMGGTTKNPTYKEVCTGTTGHVEVTRITYDPKKISYEELLEVFWKTHDPTTLNRQGNDIGTQYRSVVFYHDNTQKALAEKYKTELNAAGIFNAPIVTAIEPEKDFYIAEDYHQNYFNENGSQPYCQLVVRPKVEKFEKVFKDKLAKKKQ